jgi:hypothetical protein
MPKRIIKLSCGGICFAVHESPCCHWNLEPPFIKCAGDSGEDGAIGMKYFLTTFTALSLGSLSFRVAHLMDWREWPQRVGAWLGALVLAALVCAPFWG